MILLILLLMITHFACCLISHFKTKLAKSYKICRFYHLTSRFKVSNSQGFVVKALFGLLQKLPIKNMFSISWSIQNFSYLWDVSNIELFFLKMFTHQAQVVDLCLAVLSCFIWNRQLNIFWWFSSRFIKCQWALKIKRWVVKWF